MQNDNEINNLDFGADDYEGPEVEVTDAPVLGRPTQADFLAAAETWGACFRVFPVKIYRGLKIEKTPAITWGTGALTWAELDARRKVAKSKESSWWADYRTETRHDGIGLVTGGACEGRLGIVAIDLDKKDGKDGEASLRAYAAKHSHVIPETLTQRTLSGGLQWFFASKVTVKTVVGLVADGATLEGVDVRGDGGYTVIPPSVLDEGGDLRRYTWVNPGTAIADLPDWLEALVRREPKKKGRPSKKEVESKKLKAAFSQARQEAQAALDAAVKEVEALEDGGRNDGLNRIVFSLRGLIAHGRLDRESVEAAMTQAGLDIGLEGAEVAATIASALADLEPVDPVKEARGKGPVLDGDDCDNWAKIAQAFVEWAIERETLPRHYGHRWWVYSQEDGFFKPVTRGAIDDQCYRFLSVLKVAKESDEGVPYTVPFKGVGNKALENLQRALAANPEVRADTLPARRGAQFLVARNGVVDMGTGVVTPHDPNEFRTWALAVDYVADAPAPTFFIERMRAGGLDDAAIREVAKWVVYLAGDGPTLQKILWIWGQAGGGKSSLVRVFSNLLGASATTVTFASLANRFVGAQLEGKRMASLPDTDVKNTDATTRQSLEMLRNLSGGDPIQIEDKGQRAYQAQLDCVPVITSNYAPSLPDSSGALARRLCAFKFTSKPEWVDNLYARLDAELPAILAWAVRVGWPAVRDEGLINVGAADCDEAREAGSPVVAFVAECLAFTPGARVNNDTLWAAWQQWAVANGQNAYNSQWLTKELRAAHPELVPFKSNGKRGYEGISLKGILGLRQEIMATTFTVLPPN